MMRLAATLLLSAVVATASATEYSPPRNWKGEKVGDDKGNPVKGKDKAIWQFVQVWPDDVKLHRNYIPLVWGGSSWTAEEHHHGGQPNAQIAQDGSVRLSVRGPWEGQPGSKVAALTFSPPKSGTFHVKGRVSIDCFEGKGAAKLTVLLFSKGKLKQVILEEDLHEGEQVDLAGMAVKMGSNDELVLAPLISQWNVAGNVTVEGLVLER